MRKMILMAIAGYLWKKYKSRNATGNATRTTSGGTTASGPSTPATARPSTRY